jgi:serine/threonine protein phosphatase PrpC
MTIIPGNAQDIGDRERQEDYFGFSTLGDRDFERHGGVMMVLCDGMGGLANGAAASRAAVDAALSGYGRKPPSEDIPSALDRTLREAHQAVCGICGESGNAGSTIVMAVVWQNTLYWTSVGDSRLYLCRGSTPADQLTEDHNVASMLKAGATRGESHVIEAGSTTNPDALTAYLGAPYSPHPDKGTLPLRPGDRIIACTDGLYRGLSPEEMAAIARHGDPMSAAERLKESVLRQKLPHQDNLTVVLLEVSSPPSRLFHTFEGAGPTALGALYGAIGGFGVALALVIVLIGFGLLRFGVADPQPTDAAVPTQTSNTESGNTGAAIPPPAPSGGVPPAPGQTLSNPPSPVSRPPAANSLRPGNPDQSNGNHGGTGSANGPPSNNGRP